MQISNKPFTELDSLRADQVTTIPVMSIGPYEIRTNIIEVLEQNIGDKDNRSVEIFLMRIVEENLQSINFNPPSLCLRLLKLLPLTKLNPRKQACVLAFFRKKNGLPDDLLENDLILQGIDYSLPCSLKLFEIIFNQYKKILNDELFTDPTLEIELRVIKAKVIKVPLKKEALNSFMEYILSNKIRVKNECVLGELFQFSCLIKEIPFQNKLLSHLAKRLVNFHYENNLGPCFNMDQLENRSKFLAKCFFLQTNTKFKILKTGRYSIDIQDFVQLFSKKSDFTILSFIAREVDEVLICGKSLNIFSMRRVPKQFRDEIVSIVYKGEILIEKLQFLSLFFSNFDMEKMITRNRRHLVSEASTGSSALINALSGESPSLENNLIEAEDYLRNEIKLKSTGPFFHQLQGIIQKKMGLVEAAEQAFRTAISFYEKLAVKAGNEYAPYEMLGFILVMKDDIEEAVLKLKQTIALNPKRIRAYRVLSMMLIRLKRHDEAEMYLQMAITKFPEDVICNDLLKDLGIKKW
ncbi:MAG: hypothetical protein H0T62_04290 [Parachlamydiaceae bacterium]|nr:hypothetical protein [Parachlamydiaceae bacterium]